MNLWNFIYPITEMIGTIAFAASGAMLAIDRELDFFGVLFLGCSTAVGGGILRDTILGLTPPGAFTNPIYIVTAILTACFVFVFAARWGRMYFGGRTHIDKVINILDAVGLGVFSAVGVMTCVERGYLDSPFLCVFMGMTTGVGGGVLRDLLSRSIPAVLKKHVYAVASIAGATLCWLCTYNGISRTTAMVLGLLLTIVIRMLSTHFEWNLPKIKLTDRKEPRQ